MLTDTYNNNYKKKQITKNKFTFLTRSDQIDSLTKVNEEKETTEVNNKLLKKKYNQNFHNIVNLLLKKEKRPLVCSLVFDSRVVDYILLCIENKTLLLNKNKNKSDILFLKKLNNLSINFKKTQNINSNLKFIDIIYYLPNIKKNKMQFETRLYSDFTSLSSKVRNTLISGIYQDFDLKNAYPNILNYLCLKHNLDNTYLNRYILEVEELRNLHMDFKKLFLMIMNDEDYVIQINKDMPETGQVFLANWKKERKLLVDKLIVVYSKGKETILFDICQGIESEILEQAIFILLLKKKWNYSLLLHDGFYLLKNENNIEIIDTINSWLFYKYKYPFKFIEKDIENLLDNKPKPCVTYNYLSNISLRENFYDKTLSQFGEKKRIRYFNFIEEFKYFNSSVNKKPIKKGFRIITG